MLKDIFGSEQPTRTDGLIDAVREEMHKVSVHSEDYPTLLTYYERLNDVKAKERQPPLNRDGVMMVAGNLLGILMIVAYEQKHVMSSKGFTQLIRPKV